MNARFLLKKIHLKFDNIDISTNDMEFIFKNGKPYLLKCVFYFQNIIDSFQFYNFLLFSKEKSQVFQNRFGFTYFFFFQNQEEKEKEILH